jgi:hypothetical protein
LQVAIPALTSFIYFSTSLTISIISLSPKLIYNWIIFEATDKQMELRVICDKVFKEVFEVVL